MSENVIRTRRGAHAGAAVLILGFLFAYSAASEQLTVLGAGPGVAGRLAIFPAAGMAIAAWLFAATYCGRQMELSGWSRFGALVCTGSAGTLAAVQFFLTISNRLRGDAAALSRPDVLLTEGLLLALLGGFLVEVQDRGSLQGTSQVEGSK